jgi:helix-turn-helix protein
MRHGVPITPEKEDEIIAALETTPHASRVARALGDVSFSTVWRVADRAGIELTAGRAAKGYKRLPAEQWTKIEERLRANPKATQEEVARATGVSRSTVGRIERRSRHGAGGLLNPRA